MTRCEFEGNTGRCRKAICPACNTCSTHGVCIEPVREGCIHTANRKRGLVTVAQQSANNANATGPGARVRQNPRRTAATSDSETQTTGSADNLDAVLAQHEAEYYHPLLRRHQSAFLPTLAEVLKVRLQEGGPHLLTAAILSVTWTCLSINTLVF
jgi:hypothetical protein